MSADRLRWGDPASYKPAWGERAKLAASLVPSAVSVLEIGVGTGVFRDLVKERTTYVGADLQPLESSTVAVDLDHDPLPKGQFDYAVLLGVLEYLNQPEVAAKKVCAAAMNVIISYCCTRTQPSLEILESRARRGWVNAFSATGIERMFGLRGRVLVSSTLLTSTEEFQEFVMLFRQSQRDAGGFGA